MGIIYLLDTNVLSEPLKPNPHRGVLERLRDHSDRVATASVVWHELMYGMERMPPSRKKDTVRDYLRRLEVSRLPVLSYDESAAARHGQERAWLEQMGRTPSFADGQIAATAQAHGLILVTRNLQDFTMFRDLHLEDWWSGA